MLSDSAGFACQQYVHLNNNNNNNNNKHYINIPCVPVIRLTPCCNSPEAGNFRAAHSLHTRADCECLCLSEETPGVLSCLRNDSKSSIWSTHTDTLNTHNTDTAKRRLTILLTFPSLFVVFHTICCMLLSTIHWLFDRNTVKALISFKYMGLY